MKYEFKIKFKSNFNLIIFFFHVYQKEFDDYNQNIKPETKFGIDSILELQKYKIIDIKMQITELKSKLETLDSYKSN